MIFSRRLRRRDRTVPPKLNLTPMVDVFVVLLIFLLKSYSAEGNIQISDTHLELPTSTSTLHPEVTLTLTMTQEALYVEDKKVQDAKTVIENEDPLIQALARELEFQVRRAKFLGGLSQEDEFIGRVTILGDRKLPFSALEKVMYTCSTQGFPNIALAVSQQ